MSAHSPRTRRRAELSQHFLRRAAASRIVASTSVAPGDLVVEVGPGRGALTRPLLRRGARVLAVELDAALAGRLRAELAPRAEVVQGDFLRFALPAEPYRLVANLPFGRTAAVLRRLARTPQPPEDAWLVVQREAAWRFAGVPWAAETRWSLRLKPWWHCELGPALRPHDFDPPPRVESALLWLSRRTRPLVAAGEARLYRELTDRLLASGAPLGRALRPRLTRRQLARLARELHFDPARPPSALRFDQWLPTFRFIARERVR